MRAVVLVSVGRHPVSGRPRRAPHDARAVELGLRLAGPELALLHAGAAPEAGLREYLGMGVTELTAIATDAGADLVPLLIAHLRRLAPDLILTGRRAEGGDDTGLLPYLVATGLGLPLLADVAEAEVGAGRARVALALPRGRRRGAEVELPALMTVGASGPPPRPVAYALAQRGCITRTPPEAAGEVPATAPILAQSPHRPRPRRIRMARGTTAAARQTAATALAARGRLLDRVTPFAATAEILAFLEAAGVLKAQSVSSRAPE